MNAPYCTIVGLGFSDLSRALAGSARELACTAVRRAVRDAGLTLADVDGLLINQSALAAADTLPLGLHRDLGLGPLGLLAKLEGKGSSVIQMLQYGAMSIAAGLAKVVVCVFADTPLAAGTASGESYANASTLTGVDGWEAQYGMFGPIANHALLARRYLARVGGDERNLAAYALACREWSAGNPLAFMREQLTFDAYMDARYIVAPFRLFDCAYPVNGGAAVVLTTLERAADSPQPPVYVHGIGQGHTGVPMTRAADMQPGAGETTARGVFKTARVGPQDVTMCQFYDAFSISPMLALEAYGLCAAGEGAAFVLDGQTGPRGSLPTNTGGGQLASFYLQGMTPVSEAIIQARGNGGARQSALNDLILVNGSGGCLEYQAAIAVSPWRSLG
ncbi:acetyl-CoA acetyltransferase [Burkholderia sp. Ch1-1]|nr:acetyl-CoA acetyltransferase [Burkholderia sp. Ch1-1]